MTVLEDAPLEVARGNYQAANYQFFFDARHHSVLVRPRPDLSATMRAEAADILAAKANELVGTAGKKHAPVSIIERLGEETLRKFAAQWAFGDPQAHVSLHGCVLFRVRPGEGEAFFNRAMGVNLAELKSPPKVAEL